MYKCAKCGGEFSIKDVITKIDKLCNYSVECKVCASGKSLDDS